LTLNQQIGILTHECLHIINQHIFRKGTRDHRLFNIAGDIAINQSIPRDFLPEGAMYPDTFKDTQGNPWSENLTTEQYYELLKEEKEAQEKEKEEQDSDDSDDGDSDGQDGDSDGQDGDSDGQDGDSDGQDGDSDGQDGFQPKNGNPNLTGDEELTLDDHSKWGEIRPEDEELAKELMESTLEQAQEKARGNTPDNINDLLKLWKKAPKLSWKKILKRYVSSKKGARVSTIKKRNRRIRTLGVKGSKVSYDTPEVITLIDVSGSVSTEEIVLGLTEISEICKISNSNMTYIQVDTQAGPIEEFNPKKTTFKRLKGGGTYIAAGIKQVQDQKIPCDVVVVITDGYIEDVSKDQYWLSFKKPVIFLTTTGDMTPVGPRKVVYNIKDA